MKTIYKYPIYGQPNPVSMPGGSKILCVMLQNDQICLWADVDTDYPLITRAFTVYGTGWVRPENPGTYIGSVMSRGDLVWHVYEETI